MKTPKVSVVVAVLNEAGRVRRCIDSVLSQSHTPVELIVLDGGSTDGTVEILESYGSRLAWESGPDTGIYAAFNKGLERATGEWILFLGADDRLASASSIETLVDAAENAPEDVDLVCARGAFVDDAGHVLRVKGEPWDWDRMRAHQVVIHPGMLHRSSLFRDHGPFEERLSIAGDYEFLLRLPRETNASFVDDVVVEMRVGGVSTHGFRKMLRETREVQLRRPEISHIKAWTQYLVGVLKGMGRTMVTPIAITYVLLVPLPILSFYWLESRISFADVAAGALAVATVVALRGRFGGPLRQSAWLVPFILFALWGCLALLLSPYREEALQKGLFQVIGLATVIGTALGIAHVVRREPSLFLRLVRFMVLALGLVSVVGVAQFLLGNVFGRPDLFDLSFANELAGGPVWGPPGNIGEIQRANSLVSEPAHFGHFLGLGVAPALLRLGLGGRRFRNALQPVVPTVWAVFILLAALLSFSFLAYLVLFLCGLALRFVTHRTSRATLVALSIAALLAVAGIAVASAVAGPGVRQKIESFTLIWTGPGNEPTEVGEEDDSALVLAGNLEVMRENLRDRPITGVGLGAHPNAYEEFAPEYLRFQGLWQVNAEDAASLLIRLLSETGPVGLALFVGAWVMLLRQARRRLVPAVASARGEPAVPTLLAVSAAVSASCLAIFLASLIRFAEYFPQQLWLAMALTGCIPLLLQTRAAPVAAEADRDSVGPSPGGETEA